MDQIEGTLHKNANGRYELDDHEFTSGSSIQIYHQESGYWLFGRVEHAAKLSGYYFFSDYPHIPSFPLWEGMRVRVGDYPRDHVTVRAVFEVVDGVRSSLVEALFEKNTYPNHYKKEAEEAYKSLGRFLVEIEKLPYFDGSEVKAQ